jgi:hypothetical protein
VLTTKRRSPRYADAADELLSIEEVNDRFPGEWIVLRVARTNDRDQITHGHVLAHTKSAKLMARAAEQAFAENPAVRLYLFVGGTRVLSQEEWLRRLNELADKPYINAHW